MKQIMLSKVMKPISFLSSSKYNCYIIIMYIFQFQNIIMIFINVTLYQKSQWSDFFNSI